MVNLRRVKPALWSAVALCVALPASASGAVKVGETFGPSQSCPSNNTYIQSSSVGNRYAAPSDGVITSWSHQAGGSPATLRFKVVRPLGNNIFSLVGESALTATVANQLNTFSVRIPTRSGDVIGAFLPAAVLCIAVPAIGDTVRFATGDAPSGALAYPSTATSSKLDLSAQLEPDADADGFGDETQDQCPTDASTQSPCPDTDPPETTITKGAPKKTKKRRVKFKFASDEPGSTFECKLDKRKFKPCGSPKKLKRLKKGKHKFKVRAIDAVGNVDSSPAKDKFKVVR